MIKISPDEIQKWRVEIDNAEDFKEKEFGKFKENNKEGAGENVDYFDFGVSEQLAKRTGISWIMALFNIIHTITKNVIPTLYYKTPYILSFPKRRNPDDEISAPYAGGLLNYYHKELSLKQTNKNTVFNGYVVGMGVSKIGYTTKFGSSPTEDSVKKEQKEREKAKAKSLLEKIGFKKSKEEDKPKVNPELNEFIRSESPFIKDVNPFYFGIDPRATSIEDANYCYEIIPKRLDMVKADKTYKNTSELRGEFMGGINTSDIPETQIDSFKIINLVEVHYKTDEGINILTYAKDGKETKALRHDESVYEMDGFMYELLCFNKHPHRLYPVSDIDKIKPLQDRITMTLENILDQVDKYVPKVLVDETAVTEQGKRALRDGEIGAIVYTNKNPQEVVREATFTQLKADLVVLIDKLLDIVMIMTGLTKAQLMGLTTAETATEAQIGQAGQNLRLSDKFDQVNDFLGRQTRKFWQVIRQFVDLEEISLILGEQEVNSQTGMVKYSWMPDIDSAMAKKLAKGEYRFEIEMGSMEKPDLPILRKHLENFANVAGGFIEKLEKQGHTIDIAELIKKYFSLFPTLFINPARVIRPLNPQEIQQQQMQQMAAQRPKGKAAVQQQLQQPPPNFADIASAAAGEKGGNIPIA